MSNITEFQINQFISLKLEDGKTQLYVNGTLFTQCKFLLLEIPKNELKSVNEMNSIDEIAESLDKSQEFEDTRKELALSPEEEFWAHCSNLQAWVENDYDTRLLHRNLAFPLLKELSDGGDKMANQKFKEEIGQRYKYGNYTVQAFLYEQNYLSYLTYDEKFAGILEPEDALFMEKIRRSGYYRFIPCFDLIRDIPYVDSLFLSVNQGKITELEIDLGDGVSIIPKEMEGLTSLHTLRLDIVGQCGNIFEEIEGLELNSIKIIKTFCQHPITIPDSFGCFPNLEWLIIRGIKCKPALKLEKSFLKTKKMKYLYLDNLKLNEIPESIENLTQLEHLDLRELAINDLPIKILTQLSIEILSLTYNPSLYLSDSQIQELKKKIKKVSLFQK